MITSIEPACTAPGSGASASRTWCSTCRRPATKRVRRVPRIRNAHAVPDRHALHRALAAAPGRGRLARTPTTPRCAQRLRAASERRRPRLADGAHRPDLTTRRWRGKETAALIGGGHNGLVCAFYLARAGLKVRVLERRGVVGGAAVTEEFHPGFRNSVASYTVSLLAPKVIADMKLARSRAAHRRAADLELPADGRRPLSQVSAAGSQARRPKSPSSRRGTPNACRPITTCSSAWPTCCATFPRKHRPT